MKKQVCYAAALYVAFGFASRAMAQAPGKPLGSNRIIPLSREATERLAQANVLGEAGYRALDFGAYALAETDARQAMELDRDGFQELLAQALYGQGKMAEAFPLFAKLSMSGSPRDLFPYALLLLKSGEWAQAVDAYSKGLVLLGDTYTVSHLGPGDLAKANNHFTLEKPQPIELEAAIHIAMGVNYNSTASALLR